MKAFEYLAIKNGDLPISENLSKNIVSFPMHPYLSSEEINFIEQVIKQ